MSASVIVMIVLCGISAIIFMAIRITKPGVYGLLAKTFASLCFVGLGVAALASTNHFLPSYAVIIYGLVFGLIGDMLLDLKRTYPQNHNLFLTTGMASFGIGHIMYFIAVVMFFSPIFNQLNYILISIAIAVPITIVVILSSKILKLDFGKFLIHAIAYSQILVFMTIYCTMIAFKVQSGIILSVGMFAFLLSDLVLSMIYFGGKSESKSLCIINHTLYYVAQIAIAIFIAIPK